MAFRQTLECTTEYRDVWSWYGVRSFESVEVVQLEHHDDAPPRIFESAPCVAVRERVVPPD